MRLDVYLPASRLSPTAQMIKPGSAIVGSPGGAGRVRIDYEGNLYGAVNMGTFVERVKVAAGRHVRNYPTVARMSVPAGALQHIGVFDGETVALLHAKAERALADWLGVDKVEPAEVGREEER